MREVKFRAWDNQKKIMMLGYQWIDSNDPCMGGGVHRSFSFMRTQRSRAGGNACSAYHKVMQYTGLKDRNGKEVYEGDVLQWEDEEGEYILGPVKWREEIAIWAVDIGIGLNTIEPEDLWVPGTPYHVIGNIYENPELLNQRIIDAQG